MASNLQNVKQMPTASSLFSAYASLSALAMLIRSIFHKFIPQPVRTYLLNLFKRLLKKTRSSNKKLTLVIEEVTANGIGRNEVYDAAELYLSTKITNPSTSRLKISKSSKDKTLTVRFEKGEKIGDDFNGIPLRWSFLCKESPKRRTTPPNQDKPMSFPPTKDINYFELTVDKEHKDNVIDNYIPLILITSKSLTNVNRSLKLCTLSSNYGGGSWDKTNLEHPSTFDTLAMDPELKSSLIADLDRFVARKEFYKRVGKAWKRGYLLYGPPGTGKSSLVAAMANYLKFDIYDLRLGKMISDSELRRVLLGTANRSILVIEDIDCSVEIKNRLKDGGSNDTGQTPKIPKVQFTLSGLLNFIDGLWSSCGDKRIIVFTTNHKERLDPSLLRPGRMDMHIHLSYLTAAGFRQLAKNYLEIEGGHGLFGEIERLLGTVNVTPAQVAEELMRSEDVDVALEGVKKLLLDVQEKMNSKEEVNNEDEVNGQQENGHVIQNGDLMY